MVPPAQPRARVGFQYRHGIIRKEWIRIDRRGIRTRTVIVSIFSRPLLSKIRQGQFYNPRLRFNILNIIGFMTLNLLTTSFFLQYLTERVQSTPCLPAHPSPKINCGREQMADCEQIASTLTRQSHADPSTIRCTHFLGIRPDKFTHLISSPSWKKWHS